MRTNVNLYGNSEMCGFLVQRKSIDERFSINPNGTAICYPNRSSQQRSRCEKSEIAKILERILLELIYAYATSQYDQDVTKQGVNHSEEHVLYS